MLRIWGLRILGCIAQGLEQLVGFSPPQGTDHFGGTIGERRFHSPAAFGHGGEGRAGNSQSVQLPFLPPLLFHSPSVPQPRAPRAPAARAVNIKTGFVSASKGSVAPVPQPCRGPQPSPAAAAASLKAAGGWHGCRGFLCRLACCQEVWVLEGEQAQCCSSPLLLPWQVFGSALRRGTLL